MSVSDCLSLAHPLDVSSLLKLLIKVKVLVKDFANHKVLNYTWFIVRSIIKEKGIRLFTQGSPALNQGVSYQRACLIKHISLPIHT